MGSRGVRLGPSYTTGLVEVEEEPEPEIGR